MLTKQQNGAEDNYRNLSIVCHTKTVSHLFVLPVIFDNLKVTNVTRNSNLIYLQCSRESYYVKGDKKEVSWQNCKLHLGLLITLSARDTILTNRCFTKSTVFL